MTLTDFLMEVQHEVGRAREKFPDADMREAAFEQYNREQSGDFTDLTSEQIYHAGYDAGLRDAAGEWVAMNQGIPERQPNTHYSQVPCLVTYRGEVKVLVFNHEHMVWDDESADDFYCQLADVTAWKYLPEPYKQEKKDG